MISKKIITVLILLIMISSSISYGSLINDNNKLDVIENINFNNTINKVNLDQVQIGEVTKKIWNETSASWVDSINADIGDILTFNITVTYIPQYWISFLVYNICANDTLPNSLEYIDDSSIILWRGQKISGISGYSISQNKLFWNFTDSLFHDYYIRLYNLSKRAYLDHPDHLSILYNVSVVDCTDLGGDNNDFNIKGWESCKSRWVYGEDTATINVECPPCEGELTIQKYVKYDSTGTYGKTVDTTQTICKQHRRHTIKHKRKRHTTNRINIQNRLIRNNRRNTRPIRSK